MRVACKFLKFNRPVKIKVFDLQQLEEAGQLSSDNFAAGLEFQNLGLLR